MTTRPAKIIVASEDGTAPARRRPRPIYYPETDSRIMPDTPAHFDALIRLLLILREWYAAQPRVFVGGDMMFYWIEGDPKQSVSPDLFVAFDVAKESRRRVWKTWEEAVPAIIFEITSRKTRRKDVDRKFQLYASLGVQEYFLFDPLGEYLRPPFRGFRLVDGRYQELTPNEHGMFESDVLGLHLMARDEHVRVFNPASGDELLSPTERVHAEVAARQAAEARAEEAERRLREMQSGRNGAAGSA